MTDIASNKRDEQKVHELADTLKKHGLASSMMEAMERARSILGISSADNTEKEGIDFDSHDIDISKSDKSINELMREAGVEGAENIVISQQRVPEKSLAEAIEEGAEEKKESKLEDVAEEGSAFSHSEKEEEKADGQAADYKTDSNELYQPSPAEKTGDSTYIKPEKAPVETPEEKIRKEHKKSAYKLELEDETEEDRELLEDEFKQDFKDSSEFEGE